MEIKQHFEILNLKQSATIEEAKQSYNSLVAKYKEVKNEGHINVTNNSKIMISKLTSAFVQVEKFIKSSSNKNDIQQMETEDIKIPNGWIEVEQVENISKWEKEINEMKYRIMKRRNIQEIDYE